MAGKGKRGPGPQPETADALQAWEDYWAMGEDRSLPKLARHYQAKSKTGGKVPTRHLAQLKVWSSRWGWQARCAVRIAEEAAASRAAFRKRVQAHRERILGALEVDSARYIKRLQTGKGEDLVTDMAGLEKATKLYFQLAEEPLAEKHEVAVSEELAVEHDLSDKLTTPERLASVAGILGGLGLLIPGGSGGTAAGADPQTDEVHPPPAAPEAAGGAPA